MYKNCNVVMLSTNEKASNIVKILKDTISYTTTENISGGNYQHLYITSDEEIKEDDWFMISKNKVVQCQNWLGALGYKRDVDNAFIYIVPKYHNKIIATTDTSLGLPQLPQQFIEKYIEEYNKDNVITKVEVEYEDCGTIDSTCGLIPHISTEGDTFYMGTKLKVNLHNTINIKPIKQIKDNFTKMDFINALHKVELKDNKDYSKLWREIEENL